MASNALLMLLVFATATASADLEALQLWELREQTGANEHDCPLTRSDYTTKMKGCRCMVYYSKSKGLTVHTPNYPEPYPSNISCLLYIFFANINELVELEFLDFDVVPPVALSVGKQQDDTHDACGLRSGYACVDKLSVYLVEKDELNDDDLPECELCGSLADFQQKRYVSQGRSIFLEFHTQSNSLHRGFSARYRFIGSELNRSREWPLEEQSVITTSTKKGTTVKSTKRRGTRLSTSASATTRRTTATTHLTSEDGEDETGDNYGDADGFRPSTPIATDAKDLPAPCESIYRSHQAEGFTAASKREILWQWQSVSWSGKNCSLPFTPNAPNSSFLFDALLSESVQITFHEVRLSDEEERNQNCTFAKAFLDVFDGLPSSRKYLGRLCQVGPSVNTLLSSTSSLYMVIYNSVRSTGSLLLKFSYRFVPLDKTSTTAECKQNIVSSSDRKHGWLATPGFPFGYVQNTSCIYRLQGENDERVRVSFDTFALSFVEENADNHQRTYSCRNNSDQVVIETMSANDDLTVATLCGFKEPQKFMSAGSSLSITFAADSSLLRSAANGFNLTYSFVTNFGITSGMQVGKSCHFVYESASRNGTLRSPNYPGEYPLVTECMYEFRGKKNEQVQIWLPVFEVEGLHPCEEKLTSDYLEIQDYSSLTGENINTRWCAQRRLKREYRSLSDRLVLKFKSNSLYTGVGFDGYYEFVPTMQTAQMSSVGYRQPSLIILVLLPLKYMLQSLANSSS